MLIHSTCTFSFYKDLENKKNYKVFNIYIYFKHLYAIARLIVQILSGTDCKQRGDCLPDPQSGLNLETVRGPETRRPPTY